MRLGVCGDVFDKVELPSVMREASEKRMLQRTHARVESRRRKVE